MRELLQMFKLQYLMPLFTICLFCVSIATAETISYKFEGLIDHVGYDSASDPFRGTIQVGQSFRGTIEIDTTTVDHFPDTQSRGLYEMGLLRIGGIKTKIGSHTFLSDLPAAYADYHTVNMFNDFFDVDELSISTSDGFVKHRGPAVKGLAVDHLTIILTDPSMNMLQSDTLPFPAPQNLAGLSTNLFGIGGTIGPNNYSLNGHLTSFEIDSKSIMTGFESELILTPQSISMMTVIPEPSSIGLSAIILLMASTLNRRSQ